MWWIVGAGVVTVLVTLLALTNPLAVVAVLALAGALWGLSRLDWWQRVFLIALVLFIAAASFNVEVSDSVEYYRFVALGALAVFSWRRNGEPLTVQQRWLMAGMYGTALLALFSSLWSIDKGGSLLQAIIVLTLAAVMHGLMRGRWRDRAKVEADVALMNRILVATFTLGILLGGAGIGGGMSGRLYGVFANPNTLGGLAALGVFIGWAAYRAKPSWWRLAAIAPAIASVALSESRTAIVAVAVAALWLLLRKGPLVVIVTTYLAIVGGLIIAVTGAQNPLAPLLSRFGDNEGGTALNSRENAWASSIDLTLANPFGYGWRTGEQVFGSMHGSAGFSSGNYAVHNSYLQYLLELGLLGLIPLTILVVTLIVLCLSGPKSGVGSGLVGVVLAALAVQVTESAMFGMGQPFPYVVFLSAAALAAVSASNRAAPARAPRSALRPALVRH